MRIVHLLRKCDPAEWGGTESAVQRLMEGLRRHGVASVVYCPRLNGSPAERGLPAASANDPLVAAGWAVRRFRACVPVWGMAGEQKRQFIAVGGNLMSFDLLPALWREPDVDVIHSHTLGRLGAVALNVAGFRRIPFVVTIHGGWLDRPAALPKDLPGPPGGGWEWGKLASFLLRTRRFFAGADAVITCNEKEAALFRERHPGKKIFVQPHGVFTHAYRADHRDEAAAAFPEIRGRQMLLCLGRMDPVKNQRWLVEQSPAIFQRHPPAMLVLAGAFTDAAYADSLRQRLGELGLEDRVLLTGGLPPGDPRLIGLLQAARAVILPSLSETFGLVILEAWAAGTPVIASRTSGASALVKPGVNGWLFDLNEPKSFHESVDAVLRKPEFAQQLAAAGHDLVRAEYDATMLAGRLKHFYSELIEKKHALRHPERRRHERVHAG
jgi:starch synthase